MTTQTRILGAFLFLSGTILAEEPVKVTMEVGPSYDKHTPKNPVVMKFNRPLDMNDRTDQLQLQQEIRKIGGVHKSQIISDNTGSKVVGVELIVEKKKTSGIFDQVVGKLHKWFHLPFKK